MLDWMIVDGLCLIQSRTPTRSTLWRGRLILGMSVLILVSNGDVKRSFRICSQDQHAQAQHCLKHAQAQLMHAQAQPDLISSRRPVGAEHCGGGLLGLMR